MPNTLFCNSFMNEAGGEEPSKIHCGGEAWNPGFAMLLHQTHVNRRSFALELALFTAKLPLPYPFRAYPA